MRHRQQLRQRPDHPLVQRPRHPVEPGQPLRRESRVAREQFVPAVAAQRHGDVPPRESGEQIGGNDRGIGERLVQKRRHLGQHIQQRPALQDFLAVIGPVELRDPARVPGLVEGAFLEPDREGLDLRGRPQLRHQRHHGARINAAAQEDPQRHIADEPEAHGLFEPLAQLLGDLVLAAPVGAVRKLEVPILPEAGLPGLPGQGMSRRQLVDAFEDAVRRGHILVGEVLAQAPRLQLARAGGMLQQGLDLGTKQELRRRFPVIQAASCPGDRAPGTASGAGYPKSPRRTCRWPG